MEKRHLRYVVVGFALALTAGLLAQNVAKQYFDRGNYLLAIREFKTQLAGEGEFNPGIHFYLANSYLELGWLSQQLYQDACYYGNLYYRQMEAQGAADPLFYYFQGLCRMGLNQPEEARRSFQKASQGAREPYASYAKIWQGVWSGGIARPSGAALQLEYEAANLEKNSAAGANAGSFSSLSAPGSGDLHTLHNWLMLLIAQEQFGQAEKIFLEMDQQLLDASEEKTIQGSAYRYLYYHPLLLKYLAKLFFARALGHFEVLEKKLTNPEHLRLVRNRIGLIFEKTGHKKAPEYFRAYDNPFLKNFLGEILWNSGSRAEAEKIWKANRSSGMPLASGYAGYFSARYSAEYREGLKACIHASQESGGYDLEIVLLLASIYRLQSDSANATAVLENARYKAAENHPRFLLEYGKMMYANGPTRFNDCLKALYILQESNVVARQVHYTIQGLVNYASFRDVGRLGN